MVVVFREVRRVLKKDGVLWLNLGDSYATSNPVGRRDCGKGELREGRQEPEGSFTVNARKWRPGAWEKGKADERGQRNRNGVGAVLGLKQKDLVGIPWRVAFALQADGWYLRSDIIWSKPNPMPESVTDRPTKAHEYIFLMSKQAKYYYNHEAIKEPAIYAGDKRGERTDNRRGTKCNSVSGNTGETKNKRTVWHFATQPYKEAHFATFPEVLPSLCISAGSRIGDVILDPFGGSGTTGKVALELGRKIVHVDIGYHDLAIQRMGLNAS